MKNVLLTSAIVMSEKIVAYKTWQCTINASSLKYSLDITDKIYVSSRTLSGRRGRERKKERERERETLHTFHNDFIKLKLNLCNEDLYHQCGSSLCCRILK